MTAIKLMWAKFAEQSDKEGWRARRERMARAVHAHERSRSTRLPASFDQRAAGRSRCMDPRIQRDATTSRTPMQTFLDAMPMTKEKLIAA
jgi:hypothetical protein